MAARPGQLTRVATIVVLPRLSGDFSRPVTVRSDTNTSATRPSASAFSKSLWYGLDRLSRLPVVLQRQQQQAGDDPVADVPLIFLFHK